MSQFHNHILQFCQIIGKLEWVTNPYQWFGPQGLWVHFLHARCQAKLLDHPGWAQQGGSYFILLQPTWSFPSACTTFHSCSIWSRPWFVLDSWLLPPDLMMLLITDLFIRSLGQKCPDLLYNLCMLLHLLDSCLVSLHHS